MTTQFRPYDSSLTRVDLVFRYLEQHGGPDWLAALLKLPAHGHPDPAPFHGLNLAVEQAWYGKNGASDSLVYYPLKPKPVPVVADYQPMLDISCRNVETH